MTSLLSSSWYRVASLKPKLRSNFEVHRRLGKSEVVFLLQDHAIGKFYRFNVNAYEILGRMDGTRTVHDIWEASIACHGDNAPTQDETIGLLGQLHGADALQMDVSPDCRELFQRAQKQNKSWWSKLLRNPLAVRMPLIDPDRLILSVLPVAGRIFSRAGFAVWLLTIIWAIMTAGAHWPELSYGGIDQIFDPGNLLLLLFVYPVMKLFHELGHAITTRKWGGEVHEMGITMLVFLPVPYVDASAMSAIENKFTRMLVSASGMMVEMFLAAMALLVWINVEPGLLRLMAFNIMLVGSVSTLIFNGNPLLRFDAYYILKDYIEIPNLASRASAFLTYLAQHHLYGIEQAKSPVTRKGETSWLFGYGVAALLFRLYMTFTIVFLVAQYYYIIGVVLALWAAVLLLLVPLLKLVRYIFYNPNVALKRARMVTVSASLLAAISIVIFVIPFPSTTRAQGVLWIPDEAHVQAGTRGLVTDVLAEPFQSVTVGQPLLRMSDSTLAARIGVLEAQVHELQIRFRIENQVDRAQAALIKDQLASKQAELEREYARSEELTVRSKDDGQFIIPISNQLPGRFFNQGDQIGFVVDHESMLVRVAVSQERIGLIREALNDVEVKLAESIGETLSAVLVRDVPAAQNTLPSKVLGRQGGGSIAVDPADTKGLTPHRSVFELDLALATEPSAWRIGQRAYVKFDHGSQSLVEQWFRAGRQLFIRRFGV